MQKHVTGESNSLVNNCLKIDKITAFYTLDNRRFLMYNIITHKPFGPVRVSTGILRYDKRGGQDNPVKMSNLNNKRQQ